MKVYVLIEGGDTDLLKSLVSPAIRSIKILQRGIPVVQYYWLNTIERIYTTSTMTEDADLQLEADDMVYIISEFDSLRGINSDRRFKSVLMSVCKMQDAITQTDEYEDGDDFPNIRLLNPMIEHHWKDTTAERLHRAIGMESTVKWKHRRSKTQLSDDIHLGIYANIGHGYEAFANIVLQLPRFTLRDLEDLRDNMKLNDDVSYYAIPHLLVSGLVDVISPTHYKPHKK